MVDRDAHLGNKAMKEHKENIVLNIRRVNTFGGRMAVGAGLGHVDRLLQWLAKCRDVGGGVYGRFP